MSLGDKIRELDEQVAEAVRRAVEDLRGEMSRRLDEATLDLQRRLGEVAPELPLSFVDEEHLRRIAEEAAGPGREALEAARNEGRALAGDQARREAHESLRVALSQIDRARSQADVLQGLLEATAPYAGRAAILLLRDGQLAGWGARGFEAGPEEARAVSFPAESPPWSAVAGGGAPASVPGPRCADLVSQLGSALPREARLVPLVLRDRVAAILYADRPNDADALDLEALQVLTYGAALALETLSLRQREATATLLPADADEPTAPEPEAETVPEAAEEPAAEAPVEAPEGDAYELAEEPAFEGDFEMEVEEVEVEAAEEETAVQTPDLEPYDEYLPAGEEPESRARAGFEAPDAPATPPHGDDLLTGPHDALQMEDDTGAGAASMEEAVDDSALEADALEGAPALEELESDGEPAAEEPSGPIPWRTETQDETAVTPPPTDESGEGALEDEAPPEAGPSEEEVEERPEAGAVPPPPPKPGGVVEPPADVEGPGWAFSAAQEPVAEHEEAAHEEARRLARLLVSEIQLYNQDEVDEGRRNRDVYERLKDDIDRSRQLYEERVDPGVRETTDYFYQELVRQLAAGDAKALGI